MYVLCHSPYEKFSHTYVVPLNYLSRSNSRIIFFRKSSSFFFPHLHYLLVVRNPVVLPEKHRWHLPNSTRHSFYMWMLHLPREQKWGSVCLQTLLPQSHLTPHLTYNKCTVIINFRLIASVSQTVGGSLQFEFLFV